MAGFNLSVLGPLAVAYEEIPLSGLTSLKARALLVYLALTPGTHSRQALSGLLWPDVREDSARTSLRTALAQLRKAVGDHVQADRYTLWFNRERPHWTDADDFASACRRLQQGDPGNQAARRTLRDAVYLYRGDFLQGFPETHSELFEAWILAQREYYRRLAMDALQTLAGDALASDTPDEGIQDARCILYLDPLREEAHRTLMKLYTAAGDTAAARRQYAECVRILDAELGVLPSDDTVALAAALRNGPGTRGGRTAALQPQYRPQTGESMGQTHSFPNAIHAPVPNNLPAALTTLVGRERELATLDDLLAAGEVRLLSVVGPGGMGKSRLALAAAKRQIAAGRFAQGVYSAELAPLHDPEHILPVIAGALDLPLQSGGGRTPKEQLLDYLRAKHLLLVLDNFEQVLEGAPLITEILQAAPAVKVLVTARERLQAPGEYLFPILGLDYAEAAHDDPAGAPAAVQLFIQSAQRAAPDFGPGPEEMSRIAEICRLVEGMPLGIELAAAWIDLVSLDEIAAELRSSLDILESDRRGTPARHRSIRAVFDATWRRLDQDEQDVFAALSVFRGGFTRTAAEQVAGATLRQLGRLVAKSLIQLDRTYNRYTLHEMVRQYAAEKLAGDPEREARVRRRHSVRYCSFAQSLGAELLGARQMEAIAQLDPKAENLRAAWQWAVHRRDWPLVEEAMDGLGFFYQWRGRLQEGQDAYQRVADALNSETGVHAPILLGRALTWCSVFAHAQGKTGKAEADLTEALRLLERKPGEDAALTAARAFAWLQAGIQAFTREDSQARDRFGRSLTLYQQLGHKWGIARSQSGLAQADADAGDYGGAESRFREAIHMLREIGDRRSEAHSLHRLAILLRNAGNLPEAVDLAKESYRLYSEMADRAGIAWSAQILAECLNFTGRHEDEEALELLRYAETLAANLGDAARLSNVYQEQSLLLSKMGRYHEAHEQGERGLVLARELGQTIRVAWCQNILASVELKTGDAQTAALRLQESGQIIEASGRRHQLAIVYGLQAEVSLALGDRPGAYQLTMASLRLGTQHRDFRLFVGLRALVLLLVDAGRPQDAITAYGHLAKWPKGVADLSETQFWQQIAPQLRQVDPQVIDDLLAHAQASDVWEFAAQWATNLQEVNDDNQQCQTGGTPA